MANFHWLFWLSNPDGRFDENLLLRRLNYSKKMIEIKLSQGAKPGHGGMLLGAKVSRKLQNSQSVIRM